MKEADMNSHGSETRELAAREANGVRVVLSWHPHRNALTVLVEDDRLGDRFVVAVPSDRGLDAFYHPYAYASSGRPTAAAGAATTTHATGR
jgi:hypothetical protein